MGFFDFFKQPDINEGVKECRKTAGAVLLDIRSPQEYREGHIPGSRNVPQQDLYSMESIVKSRETPVFVYCYSGARSRQAVSVLKSLGYSNVSNIGGIASYTGKVERS